MPFYARSNRGAGTSYVFVGEEPKNNAGDFRRWLASATSVSSVGESAAAAFDGNPDTAWVAGGAEYPQGLIVDLGESKDIGSVRLTFPSKQAWKYKIMCSANGDSWQEYADNSQNSDNISVYNETAKASARYVALLLVESAGVGYATVSEIEVFEGGGTQNLALNKMCGASSVNETGFSAFSMIDGNNSTRYCPDGESKPQTVTFDLGGDTSFEGIEILFEKPTRWTYNVQLSSDGINWSEYVSETFDMSSDGQLRTIEKSGKARYLRISITATTGGVWASVWDIRLIKPSGGTDLFESLLSYAGKPEEPDDPAKLRGDINKDGVVNVSDILTLKNLIMSGEYTDEQLKAGDLDENGTLTVGDILSVKDIIMSGK